MAKATMQKWQRDHFVSELNRNYDPLINAAELKLKSIEAEAIEIAEKNLADDIGATPIINELEEAMETLKQKMSKAARFFNKTKHAKKDISYKFKEKDFSLFGYNSTRITPDVSQSRSLYLMPFYFPPMLQVFFLPEFVLFFPLQNHRPNLLSVPSNHPELCELSYNQIS